MEILTALDAVREAPSILEGIRRADDLRAAAAAVGRSHGVRPLALAASDPDDQLTAIAAVHALAHVPSGSADPALVSLLSHDALYLREHAAWALGARAPQPGAIEALIGMIAEGGFVGMLAQRTVEEWSGTAPDPIARALDVALGGVADPGARARLVETVGRGPGRTPEALLRRVAADPDEGVAARVAAIEALGDRRPTEQTTAMVASLARGTGIIAEVARLALFDLTTAPQPPSASAPGSTIAQLFLHADVDRDLSRVGAGDNGGIATLLVRLGDALVARSQPGNWNASHHPTQVGRVVTIARGRHDDALASVAGLGSGLETHAYATVPFVGEHVGWPRRGHGGSRRSAASIGSCARQDPSKRSTCGWPTSAPSRPPRWPVNGVSRSSSPWRPTRTPRSTGRTDRVR